MIGLLKYKKLNERAKAPSYGSEGAAGLDLYAISEESEQGAYCIQPNHTSKIKTGIAVEIPEGYFGAIFARSGIATKNGLRPANCVGVVDEDYRGEVVVPIYNDSETIQYIEDGTRIAQLVILPYMRTIVTEVDKLSGTERGDGGFGSTGTL